MNRVYDNLERELIRNPHMVVWKKPEIALVKLNTDGSVMGSPPLAAYVGVIQSAKGEWIYSYSRFLGNKDILFAELNSIRVGLEKAWELGFIQLWCETDSLEAWRLISMDNPPYFHVYEALLADAYALIRRSWIVKVTHVF